MDASYRFLNIRLDNIKVLDEARHPHMVRTRLIVRFERAYRLLDGCQELLHPWFCRQICAASS